MGGCRGSGSGGGRLVVWVMGVSEGRGGRGSVGELRKVEVVSKVPVDRPAQTCKKQPPVKHAKIEVRKRKYSEKKKSSRMTFTNSFAENRSRECTSVKKGRQADTCE